jgi:hypothetical protein
LILANASIDCFKVSSSHALHCTPTYSARTYCGVDLCARLCSAEPVVHRKKHTKIHTPTLKCAHMSARKPSPLHPGLRGSGKALAQCPRQRLEGTGVFCSTCSACQSDVFISLSALAKATTRLCSYSGTHSFHSQRTEIQPRQWLPG